MLKQRVKHTLSALCLGVLAPIVCGSVFVQAQEVPLQEAVKTEGVDNVQSPTQPPAEDSVPDQDARRIVVTFNESANADQDYRMDAINDTLAEFGSAGSLVRKAFDGSYIVRLDPPVPAAQVPALEDALEVSADVDIAELDPFIQFVKPYQGRVESTPHDIPNDPTFFRQWHLFGEHSVRANQAWDLGFKGAGVNVAVVDTGITEHPDLSERILPGMDMMSDPNMARDGDERDDDPSDEGDWIEEDQCEEYRPHPAFDSTWHGTHVAGIIGATQNNRQGVSGVAPESNIVPVRVLGACGGFNSDVADGVAWASGAFVPGMPDNPNPARIINLSLGSDEYCQQIFQRSIDMASLRGSVILVAAGNENMHTTVKAPGNCHNVITVGATGPEGYRSNYSNYGADVDFGAPGGNSFPHGLDEDPVYGAGIYSTVNRGKTTPTDPGYAEMNGTSMATPVAAGVVAMMLEANPDLIPTQIERILEETAQPYEVEPWEFEYGNDPGKTRFSMGAGIVDARAAVCRAINEGGGDCDMQG